jgi:hypothetical protein
MAWRLAALTPLVEGVTRDATAAPKSPRIVDHRPCGSLRPAFGEEYAAGVQSVDGDAVRASRQAMYRRASGE